jgi:hypothetical protein
MIGTAAQRNGTERRNVIGKRDGGAGCQANFRPPSARGGRISLDISFYRTTGDAKNAKRRHTPFSDRSAALRAADMATSSEAETEYRRKDRQTGRLCDAVHPLMKTG